jgi:hypothetical protein
MERELVAIDTPRGLASSAGALDGHTRTLFAYDVSKDGKVVTRLYGFESDDHKIRVAAETYPFTAREDVAPEWLFFDFSTHDQSLRFADEVLLALEYLGCTFTETGAEGTASRLLDGKSR